MTRRDFLHCLGIAAAVGRVPADDASPAVIRSVTGDLLPGELGLTLVHEHVLVDFIGAGQVSPRRYDPNEVFQVVLPFLEQAATLGVRTVFECTPNFLGRDAHLLVRLSRASGVNLVTNTGLYGAVGDKFLPPWAFTESAEQLAQRWITEAREGIDGTGVRPGFIKSAVDPEPEMSEVDRKLVKAAALTHRVTGLTIAVHTGRGPGNAQLAELRTHGVAASAFVWVHAQNAPDDALVAAANSGAWLSFDGLTQHNRSRHLELCRLFRNRGQLDRVMLSHDAGWFDPAKPKGGPFRPYDLLFTQFLPQLRADGFADQDIRQILILNPAKAYALAPRLI